MQRLSAYQTENTSLIHPKYRQIALTVYAGVLILGLYGWLSDVPAVLLFSSSPSVSVLLFFTAVVTLIALELGRQMPQFKHIIRPKVHWVAQILLSAVALTTAPYFYAQFLFLIVILFAEISFSRWISYLTIGITYSILFLRLAFGQRGDFISTRDLESLLIFALAMWLVLLLARLIKGEWENRLNLQTLNDQLQQSNQQLQQNTEQLAELAVVSERNRLARDIHDGLGHHLAAVSIQLEMAMKLYEQVPSEALIAMGHAKTATQEALQDVRRSVGSLRDQDGPFDFVPAIELLIERIANDDLSISYQLDGNADDYSKSTLLTFFRAIQEGLTNIHKHAAASQANLWLQFAADQARLRIIDDGVGFNFETQTNGLGLQGVRERVETLGGRVEIASRSNEGTILDISIPQT